MTKAVPIDKIESKILVIRGKRIMLDVDLAELYGVKTKHLNRQVKRNLLRFPPQYMFQLTEEEKNKVVPNWHHLGKLKYSHQLPYAFTEHGVAMLSAVLNSPRAIKTSIYIINTFIRLRQLLSNNKVLANMIMELERKYGKHELEISTLFNILKKLVTKPLIKKPKRQIGFLR